MCDTNATMLINQIGDIHGFNIKSVSQRLRHANVKTTFATYTYALKEADTLVADTILNLLQIQ